jgi:hypothetical protein
MPALMIHHHSAPGRSSSSQLLALSAVLFSCASADVAVIRPKAAEVLRCTPDNVHVTVTQGLAARAVACGKQAVYLKDSASGAWELESVYPVDETGTAYVPACSGGAYFRFVSEELKPDEVELSEGAALPDAGISAPKLVVQAPMQYPEAPSGSHRFAQEPLEADVKARCLMDRLGLLECCDLTGTEQLRLFESVVRENIASRRYEPAAKEGQPTSCWYVFMIQFRTP